MKNTVNLQEKIMQTTWIDELFELALSHNLCDDLSHMMHFGALDTFSKVGIISSPQKSILTTSEIK